ncbi:MAG: thiamine pyrophosphate-binding protein, partial [Akkermansiaceae bacterium]|nr:thiamine pyrophosphate-binding protein [Akkermansiaceae bacterium]
QVEEFAAGRWDPLPRGKKFIHADADPTQFARNWVPDVTLCGDAVVVLAQLVEACREGASP